MGIHKKKVLLLFIVMSFPLFGQTIFPGFSGSELIDSLVANYKTNTVLSYADARDTLFAKIYAINDSLTAVYSGYTIYLDPTKDPNQDAYNKGIDTEHTYPRSKGASGQAESDMYHLYPTRRVVNSSRGNDPFAEIPDTDTDKWFRLDVVLNTIPPQFIDEYSEKDDDGMLFEPREDHKGNAARAIFYFYTMYKQKADSADPQFFQIQKNTLYQWHLVDPVDSLESIRNDKIAFYQGGKKNPFILDSTLVQRAYFPNAVVVNEPGELTTKFELWQNYPNPFNSTTNFRFRILDFGYIELKIYDLLGREIKTLLNENLTQGSYEVRWHGKKDDGEEAASGVYVYQLKAGEFVRAKKMLLIK